MKVPAGRPLLPSTLLLRIALLVRHLVGTLRGDEGASALLWLLLPRLMGGTLRVEFCVDTVVRREVPSFRVALPESIGIPRVAEGVKVVGDRFSGNFDGGDEDKVG